MKKKEEKVEEIPKDIIKFCPRCHRKVNISGMFGNMKFKGNVRIGCSNCKKGVIIISSKE